MRWLKVLPLMFLACCIPFADWGEYHRTDDHSGCVTEDEIAEGWYGYLGVAPFISPIVICGTMDLLEDDYYTFTYANNAPIVVDITYEGPENSETHLVIREMGKKRNGEIAWGPVLESTTMEDRHSTTLTIFPVDGYERVVVALVPCIVDQGITPYKMEINAR
jgi:hypothetical protein